jgi:hypothetical protein
MLMQFSRREKRRGILAEDPRKETLFDRIALRSLTGQKRRLPLYGFRRVRGQGNRGESNSQYSEM